MVCAFAHYGDSVMFETLSDKLRKVLKELRGQGRLTEAHIGAAMREIRIALLEADVNYKVVKSLIDRIKEKATGQEVIGSLSPAQQVVKIVHDELVEILGGTSTQLIFTRRIPNSVMIVGLQGSGKTTTAGKLAKHLADTQKRKPLLLSVDVYRPAARQQLSIIAKSIGQPVFEGAGIDDPLELCRQAVRECQLVGYDPLLIDTAGRLHIDEELMTELQRINQETHPGERYDALETFYPDRIAQRILGMGDVLSLIEKVQSEVDQEKALELQEKLMRDRFTLEDFRDQLRQVKKLGSFDKLLDMLPSSLLGGFRVTPEQRIEMEQKLKLTEAIINSMTPGERVDHNILNGSRRKRIARGSGTSVQEVNQMVNEYTEMRKMMRMMTSGRMGSLMGAVPGMGGMGGLGGGARRKATKRR